ncbi:MAG: branched-chain amino acid ABC transporter permease [Dehalococcoidia bacterium]|jgi:branched-chain amino acid transport system permease protein|nr:branched-chain amino acid ABC transporter permease [Dehalococcoidia bacterium]MDW8009734.1 branched-chain amino acid ABC transporter permease [Chloroflexota bacterium]
MDQLAEQIITGLMSGTVYGLFALVLVLIFQSTNMLNFGQGEMATFTTYLGWALMVLIPYWPGFIVAAIVAFIIGAALQRGLIRLVEDKPPTSAFIVGLGLFLIFNSLSGAIFGPEPKSFEQPWTGSPFKLGDITIVRYNLFIFLVSLVVMAVLTAFMRFTKLGIALRATAMDRAAAELMGIPTSRMLMLGWGLAAMLGAIAAMLVAPVIILHPGMMFFVLMFGFTAAVLGGLDSLPGAVVGGLIIGVLQNLVGVYLPDVVDALRLPFDIRDGNQYRDIALVVVLLLVLMFRPHGLFGKSTIERK